MRALSPGYFAFVMAAGILSEGVRLRNVEWLSDVFLAAAGVGFVVIAVLHLWRLGGYPRAMLTDLRDPQRSFGFFTFVAGVDVIATDLASRDLHTWALVMLVVGTVGWVALGYVVPWLSIFAHGHLSAIRAANGSWFVWVVAAQSVAVVAAILQPLGLDGHTGLALLATISWAVGVFLYVVAGLTVVLRALLYEFSVADLSPSYWVSMGAAAITVLAGSRLVEMHGAPLAHAMEPLITGLSVMFWAFATWLIPALTVAFWWRHWVRRVPLNYDPELWTLIFPLGMYGVASIDLGHAVDLWIVRTIGQVEVWVGVAAFAITFVAMLKHLYAQILSTADAGPPEARAR